MALSPVLQDDLLAANRSSAEVIAEAAAARQQQRLRKWCTDPLRSPLGLLGGQLLLFAGITGLVANMQIEGVPVEEASCGLPHRPPQCPQPPPCGRCSCCTTRTTHGSSAHAR